MGDFNGLIKSLREEIAICGRRGATVKDILAGIENFYFKKAEALGRNVPNQKIDRPFQERVWSWLVKDKLVYVGIDREGNSLSLTEIEARNLESKPLHLFTTEQQIWITLSGHEKDIRKIPPKTFELLEIIASRRGKGITQPEIVKVSGQDKRSVPNRTDKLAESGHILKIRVLANSANTSLLIHRRYKESINTSVDTSKASRKGNEHPDDLVFLGRNKFARAEKSIRHAVQFLEDEGGILLWTDLKNKIGINDSRSSKLVAECIRRLEDRGIVERVRGSTDNEPYNDTSEYHRCVRLIKRPTEDDWTFMFQITPKEQQQALASSIQNGENEEEDGVATRDSLQSRTDESVSSPDPETSETQAYRDLHVPLWSPDRLLAHTVRSALLQTGTVGLSTKDLKKVVTGPVYMRPIDRFLDRCVWKWVRSQPSHIRHLAIVRDSAQLGKTSFYVHFAHDAFGIKVDNQETMWEAVQSTYHSDVMVKTDGYGFRVPQASEFAGKLGNLNLRAALKAAPHARHVITFEDTTFKAATRKGKGSVSSTAKKAPRRQSGEQSEDMEPSPMTIGRPRKYANLGETLDTSKMSPELLMKAVVSQRRAQEYLRKKAHKHVDAMVAQGVDRNEAETRAIEIYGLTSESYLVNTIHAPKGIDPDILTKTRTKGTKKRKRKDTDIRYLPSILAHTISRLGAPLKITGNAPPAKKQKIESVPEEQKYRPSILAHSRPFIEVSKLTISASGRPQRSRKSTKAFEPSPTPIVPSTSPKKSMKMKRLSKAKEIINSNDKPSRVDNVTNTPDLANETTIAKPVFPAVAIQDNALPTAATPTRKPKSFVEAVSKTSLPVAKATAATAKPTSPLETLSLVNQVGAAQNDFDSAGTRDNANSSSTIPATAVHQSNLLNKNYKTASRNYSASQPPRSTAGPNVPGRMTNTSSPKTDHSLTTHEDGYTGQAGLITMKRTTTTFDRSGADGTRPGTEPTGSLSRHPSLSNPAHQYMPPAQQPFSTPTASHKSVQSHTATPIPPFTTHDQQGCTTSPLTQLKSPQSAGNPSAPLGKRSSPVIPSTDITDVVARAKAVLATPFRKRQAPSSSVELVSASKKSRTQSSTTDASGVGKETVASISNPAASSPAVSRSAVSSGPRGISTADTSSKERSATSMTDEASTAGLKDRPGRTSLLDESHLQTPQSTSSKSTVARKATMQTPSRRPQGDPAPNNTANPSTITDDISVAAKTPTTPADHEITSTATSDTINTIYTPKEDRNTTHMRESTSGSAHSELTPFIKQKPSVQQQDSDKPLPPAAGPTTKKRNKPLQPRMTPFGGTIAAMRKLIILNIVHNCGGAFPGDGELVYPFLTAYARKFPDAKPDSKTIKVAKTLLIGEGKLKQIFFTCKNLQGMVQSKSIVALPEIHDTNPIIKDMTIAIAKAHPHPYFPPGTDIRPDLLPRSATYSGSGVVIFKRGLYANDLPVVTDQIVPTFSSKTSKSSSDVHAKESQDNSRHQDPRQTAFDKKKLQRAIPKRPNELASENIDSETDNTAHSSNAVNTQSVLNSRDPAFATFANPGVIIDGTIPGLTATDSLAGHEIDAIPIPRQLETPTVEAGRLENIISPLQPPQKKVRKSRAKKAVAEAEDLAPASEQPKKTRKRKQVGDPPNDTSLVSAGQPRGHDTLITPIEVEPPKKKQKRSKKRTESSIVPSKATPDPTSNVSSRAASTDGTSRRPSRDGPLDSFEMSPPASGIPGDVFINYTFPEGPRHFVEVVPNKRGRRPKPKPDLPVGQQEAPVVAQKPVRIRKAPAEGQRAKRITKPQKPNVPKLSALETLAKKEEKTPGIHFSKNVTRERQLTTRRTRFLWNPEDDRKLLIANLFGHVALGGIREENHWAIVSRMLEHKYDREMCRRRWPTLRTSHRSDMEAITSALRSTLLDGYERGDVPPINYDNFWDNDWKGILDWAIDKVENPRDGDFELPATRADFEAAFLTQDFPQHDGADFLEGKRISNGPLRQSLLNSGARVVTEDSSKPITVLDAAKSYIRANVVTSKETYNPDAARQKLSNFSEATIDQALGELLSDKILAQANKGRALPGRSYDVSNQFLKTLQWKLSVAHFKYAAAFKEVMDKHFEDQGALEYNPAFSNGDMMSLLNLLVDGMVTLEGKNIPNKRSGLTTQGYKTRSMDKRVFNFGISIKPTKDYVKGARYQPLPPLPTQATGLSDDIPLIPFWVDIHGQILPAMWDLAVAAISHALAVNTTADASSIAGRLMGCVAPFEVQLIMEWLVDAGVAEWKDERCDVLNLKTWWWSVIDTPIAMNGDEGIMIAGVPM